LASQQKRRNQIDVLTTEEISHYDHEQKAAIAYQHFCNLIGTQQHQSTQFDYTNLMESHHDLMQNLQGQFTEHELMTVIISWPNNKSPGPDDYTGEFLKKFKDTIIPDMLYTFNCILTTPDQAMNKLNYSYIVLIPKKEGVTKVKDYRPISLLNSMQKCFSKLLANRLQPIMEKLIHPSQMGFMKNIHINEGFLYAQELVTRVTRQNTHITLFKADI
jgi:Reverse transcriptase (RNA-dependent DNA polymerase)